MKYIDVGQASQVYENSFFCGYEYYCLIDMFWQTEVGCINSKVAAVHWRGSYTIIYKIPNLNQNYKYF